MREAATAVREHGYGLKAPTITWESAGDVGSPNRILREEIGGRSSSGRAGASRESSRSEASTDPLGRPYGRGDADGAQEWREGAGEARSPSARSASSARSATPSPSSRSGRRSAGTPSRPPRSSRTRMTTVAGPQDARPAKRASKPSQGHPHGRLRWPPQDEGVHGRGDPPRDDEARRLGDALSTVRRTDRLWSQ